MKKLIISISLIALATIDLHCMARRQGRTRGHHVDATEMPSFGATDDAAMHRRGRTRGHRRDVTEMPSLGATDNGTMHRRHRVERSRHDATPSVSAPSSVHDNYTAVAQEVLQAHGPQGLAEWICKEAQMLAAQAS